MFNPGFFSPGFDPSDVQSCTMEGLLWASWSSPVERMVMSAALSEAVRYGVVGKDDGVLYTQGRAQPHSVSNLIYRWSNVCCSCG